jgi:uncharacterized membrane protein YhiD involved in acid resistance
MSPLPELSLFLSGYFTDILTPLLASFLLSLVVVFFYHTTNKGFSYENSFSFTLVLVTVIVTAVMLTISSNIALSLGLIGSLSIIRFRTAVKNSADMAFIFWSIAVGLANGAGNVSVAVATTLVISGVVYAFNKWGTYLKSNTDYILVARFGSTCKQKTIDHLLTKASLHWKLKSAHATKEETELTYSLYSRDAARISQLTEDISKLKGVLDTSLLTPETNLFI